MMFLYNIRINRNNNNNNRINKNIHDIIFKIIMIILCI